MKIKLDPGAKMPTRAHPTDAGLDLYAADNALIFPNDELTYSCSAVIDTGVHIAFDHGTYGKIESKSGLNINNHIVSCGGVIDEGYTGSIKVKLYNFSKKEYLVRKGDKIAQLVIMPYLTPAMDLVEDLEETERGNAGFGSTGR